MTAASAGNRGTVEQRRRCPPEVVSLLGGNGVHRGRDVGRQRRCPPERRQGAIQRERALRFEWMGWLRAFIAGVVLALGLARVSPSGKARASQARMRGFESRHPLQKKVKAGLQFRTAPHRWRFIRRPAFLMGASRFCQLTWDIGKSTSSLACISLSQDLPHCPR